MHAIQSEKFKLLTQLHFHAVGDFTQHGISGIPPQRQVDIGKIPQIEAQKQKLGLPTAKSCEILERAGQIQKAGNGINFGFVISSLAMSMPLVMNGNPGMMNSMEQM